MMTRITACTRLLLLLLLWRVGAIPATHDHPRRFDAMCRDPGEMTSEDVAVLLHDHGGRSLQSLADVVRDHALDGSQLVRFPMLQQVVGEACRGEIWATERAAKTEAVEDRGAGKGWQRVESPQDPCSDQFSPDHDRPLPPRGCWAERGAAEARRWSLTLLTRQPMEDIYFRGELLADPPFRPPIPVDRQHLCDGSQTGGGPCHYGVTRSYLRGLQQIAHPDFTFNPPNASLFGDVLWILSGMGASGGALCAKVAAAKRARAPGAMLVVAGPNVDVADLEACDAVDLFLAPSQWTAEAAVRIPRTAEKSHAQLSVVRRAAVPAGVDTGFWRPQRAKALRTGILLYDKSVVSDGALPGAFLDAVMLEHPLIVLTRALVRFSFSLSLPPSLSPSHTLTHSLTHSLMLCLTPTQVHHELVATKRNVRVFRYGFEFDGYSQLDFREALVCVCARFPVLVSPSFPPSLPPSLPPPSQSTLLCTWVPFRVAVFVTVRASFHSVTRARHWPCSPVGTTRARTHTRTRARWRSSCRDPSRRAWPWLKRGQWMCRRWSGKVLQASPAQSSASVIQPRISLPIPVCAQCLQPHRLPTRGASQACTLHSRAARRRHLRASEL